MSAIERAGARERKVTSSVRTARSALDLANPDHDLANPDQLFCALDGRSVGVLGRRCQIRVYSVRDEDSRRWVQLGLVGRQSYMITLRLAAGDSVEGVMAALSSDAPVSQVHLAHGI